MRCKRIDEGTISRGDQSEISEISSWYHEDLADTDLDERLAELDRRLARAGLVRVPRGTAAEAEEAAR